MKTFAQRLFLAALTSCLLFACSSEINQTVSVPNSEETEFKPNHLTCDQLLDKHEDLSGHVVNLKAISWGSNLSVDGEEILLSLADTELDGLQQAHVLVHFSKEQQKEIEAIDENESVLLTAEVGDYEYGALRLKDAKIIE